MTIPRRRTFVSHLRRLLQPKALFIPVAVITLPIIRIIRPWLLIRWGNLISHALGHFALNTELYLCERDHHVNRPKQRYIDFPYFGDPRVSNTYLMKMWRRTFKTFPPAPLQALEWVNNVVPGGAPHRIGSNVHNDRDIFNLMAGSPAHLAFSEEEQARGKKFLESLGITDGAPYICLNVRDSSYYGAIRVSNSRHSHRDSSIANYVEAAEALVDRGFFVLRMGRKVEAPLLSSRAQIVDYAYERMGDDFLDLYIGAHCDFCLSSGSGFDAIPAIFRRPVSFVNLCPIETALSSETYLVYLSKWHLDSTTGDPLTLRQIVERNLAWRASPENYAASNIVLRENSPGEIRDVAVESVERLQGTWPTDPVGEELQKRFKEILPLSLENKASPLHGEFRIRYSERFLKDNPWWLE